MSSFLEKSNRRYLMSLDSIAHISYMTAIMFIAVSLLLVLQLVTLRHIIRWRRNRQLPTITDKYWLLYRKNLCISLQISVPLSLALTGAGYIFSLDHALYATCAFIVLIGISAFISWNAGRRYSGEN